MSKAFTDEEAAEAPRVVAPGNTINRLVPRLRIWRSTAELAP